MPRSKWAVQAKCYPSARGVLMNPTVCASSQATSVCPTSDSPAGWNEEDGRSPSAGQCSTWVSWWWNILGNETLLMVDSVQADNGGALLHASAPMTHFCSCASNFPLWKTKCIPFSALEYEKLTFLSNHILSVLFLLFGPSSSRGFKRRSLQPCCWLVVPWHSVVCTSDGKGQVT